jgi:hypothetical protein
MAVDVANIRMATRAESMGGPSLIHARSHGERLQQGVVEACGEIALCKVMNWYWSPEVGGYRPKSEVGANIEVRAYARPDGSLIIRDSDAEDRWYVGIFGEPPFLYVAGFIQGAHAKRDEWAYHHEGISSAWFVPQSELQPIRVQNNF